MGENSFKMYQKPNPSSEVPLTPSGRTPSVTGLALQRKARGPDPRKFLVVGGEIRAAAPDEDAPLLNSFLSPSETTDARTRSSMILQSAQANLMAGMSFLEKQRQNLKLIAEKLSDATRLWKLSRISGLENDQLEKLQSQFQQSRDEIEGIREANDGSVPLFSDGQSSPIRMHHPSARKWQLLLIDRSDLGTASMITFSHGKIYGDTPGFHLDLDTLQKTRESIRNPLSYNEMQSKLLRSCLRGVKQRLLQDSGTVPDTGVPCVPISAHSNTLFRSFN